MAHVDHRHFMHAWMGAPARGFVSHPRTWQPPYRRPSCVAGSSGQPFQHLHHRSARDKAGAGVRVEGFGPGRSAGFGGSNIWGGSARDSASWRWPTVSLGAAEACTSSWRPSRRAEKSSLECHSTNASERSAVRGRPLRCGARDLWVAARYGGTRRPGASPAPLRSSALLCRALIACFWARQTTRQCPLHHSQSCFSTVLPASQKNSQKCPLRRSVLFPLAPRTLPVVVRGCPGHRRHTPKPVSASESALVTTTGHKRIRHVLALQNGGNHAGCLAHAGRLVPAGTREARLIGPEPRSPSPAHSLLFGGTSTAFAILTALAALAALAAATILGASRRAAGRRCGARRLGRGLAAAAASTAPLAGVGGSP